MLVFYAFLNCLVVDISGSVIQGATVNATNGVNRVSGVTNSYGEVALEFFQSGIWSVYVSKTGYKNSATQNINVSSLGYAYSTTFNLSVSSGGGEGIGGGGLALGVIAVALAIAGFLILRS